MISQRSWRSIVVGGTVITALLLLGVLKAIFGVEVGTNLFSTGLTPAVILGFLQLIIAWGIYKH
ncbi:unnamed protein product, partial [marine sediment metagenome]